MEQGRAPARVRTPAQNPNLRKGKIAAILKCDHGTTLSVGTVGRILARLLAEGIVQRSLSAPQVKPSAAFCQAGERVALLDCNAIRMGERM